MVKVRIWWLFVVLNLICSLFALILYLKQVKRVILPITNVERELRSEKTSLTTNSTTIENKRDVHSNDSCDNLSLASLSGVKMTSSGWQEVRGQSDMLVYSAFWDARLPKRPSVMILGLKSESYDQSLWCLLWYEEAESAVITSARYRDARQLKPGR